MTVVVPLGLWMIVRVGWTGVPLADRSTCGWFFLGAARVEGTAAEARATVATTKAKARIAPHFLELQHSRIPCRAIAERSASTKSKTSAIYRMVK